MTDKEIRENEIAREEYRASWIEAEYVVAGWWEMTEKEKKLKDDIALLFKNARAEGSIRKWEDGVTDAEEVLTLIEAAGCKSLEEMTEQELIEQIAIKLARWKADIIYSIENECKVLFASPLTITESLIPLLKEWAEANGYVQLAEDQTAPLVPDDYEDFAYTYLASQSDMLTAGWRKVILEG